VIKKRLLHLFKYVLHLYHTATNMKSTAFLTVVLLFSLITTAQTWEQFPTKGKTSKIAVLLTDTSKSVQRITNVLINSGYPITYVNNEFKQISTGAKGINNLTIAYNITCTATDSGTFVLFTATATMNVGYVVTHPNVSNRSMPGSPLDNLWQEYDNVTAQLLGKKYYYNHLKKVPF
jgi:hypothetical protein